MKKEFKAPKLVVKKIETVNVIAGSTTEMKTKSVSLEGLAWVDNWYKTTNN